MRQMAKTALHVCIRTTFGETTRVEDSSVAVLKGISDGKRRFVLRSLMFGDWPETGFGEIAPIVSY